MDLSRASLFVTLMRLGSIAAWAAIGVLTARVLSVSDRGIYATAVIAAEIVGALAANFTSGCSHQVAREGRALGVVARAGLMLAASTTTAGVLVVLGIAAAFPGEYRGVILLVGLMLPPKVARSVFSSVFFASGAVGRGQIVAMGGAYFGLAFLVLGFFAFGIETAEGALALWTAAQYANLAVAALMASGWLLVPGERAAGLIRALATFGTVAGLAGLIGLLQRRADLFLVAGLEGARGAGLYSAAISVAELLLILPGAIATAAMARLGRGRDDDATSLLTTCTRHAVLLATAGGLVVLVLGPVALRVAFGPVYEDAATPLRILAIAGLLIAPQSVVVTYFIVRLGRPVLSVLVVASAAAAEIGSGLVLISLFGLPGAALAGAIGYGTGAVVLTATLVRVAPVTVREVWLPTTADIALYRRGLGPFVRSLAGRPSAVPSSSV